MFALFTDFGLNGPYLGQLKVVLYQAAPERPVIDLFADAPMFDPRASAYLLAAYAEALPSQSVVIAVVDPGVGTNRPALAMRADERWYVGPDNGLLSIVAQRALHLDAWQSVWRPEALSASFHGRDLFAPVAAGLSKGDMPTGDRTRLTDMIGGDWPEDLPEVIYIDVYGNVMTGLRACRLGWDSDLQVAGRRLARARTFSDVPEGDAFWYENANGLAEIAVNQGHACRDLELGIGDSVRVMRKGR